MDRLSSVTLSLCLVLILTAWNIVKVWTLLAWQDVLIEFSVQINPKLIAFISIIWIFVGSIVFWGVLQKKAWSVKMLPAFVTGYTVWYWSERLIWQNGKTNLWFAIAINFVLLIIVYFSTKSLSREAYERSNQTTE